MFLIEEVQFLLWKGFLKILSKSIERKNFDEEVELQLNFDAMTSETDQMITGKVLSAHSDSYSIKN